MPRTAFVFFLTVFAACAQRQAEVATDVDALEDFSAGVAAANHPDGAGQYRVWYDAADNTFGTPSAATLDGAPAMRIDDGGFVNGVYAIFPAAIPSTGRYRVEARIHVVESSATVTDAIDSYQIGAAAGALAVHRGPNPSALPGLPAFGSYVGLTNNDDTPLGSQVVATSEFDAVAGDDLLIAFGTDVVSGAWNGGSGAWSGGYVLVSSIELVPVAADPTYLVDDDHGPPAFTTTGAWTVSGGVGFGGGVYRFSSTGNPATASWSALLPAGFYDVQVTYRAGANRASAAAYSVHAGNDTLLTRSIDQQYRDLSWVKLGLIEVATATSVTVTLDAAASAPAGRVVIADAVRFVPSDGPPPIDPPEMRIAAITVFDDIDDPGAIQAIVDELADLHYNAVAVHARYRGDATYFPNKLDTTYPNFEPRNPQAGTIDVLEEMVNRGHAAGLRVFAYVNTHLVTSGVDTVADPLHVVNVHPEWRTWARAGGTPEVQTTAHDPEGLWLEPALPAVRKYLADVVGDIAKNYAIDGVILDRIRYPQTSFTRENRDFGYHPDAIATFNFLYGKRGIPDPYDRDWIEFRQRAITETVGAIYNRLQDIDPNLMLLAYPIGRYNDAIEYNYQDWPRWLYEHRIDAVLPQIYTSDPSNFDASLAQHAAAYAGDRFVGVTLNAFTPGIDLAGQIEAVRAAGFSGSSPFRHGTMGALGYLDHLEVAWDGVAAFPEMPWKGLPILPLAIHGLCRESGGSTRSWRIENDNASSVFVSWWIVGSTAQGSVLAPPGESTFTTSAVGPLSLLLATWHDHRGHLQGTIALSLPIPCPKSR